MDNCIVVKYLLSHVFIMFRTCFSVYLIGKIEYAGCKFDELGDKVDIKQSSRFNNTFTHKITERLDVAGIQYRAKIFETTMLPVKPENMSKQNEVKKILVNEPNPQKQKQTSR